MPIETVAKSKKARRRLVEQSYGKRSTGRRSSSASTVRPSVSRAQAERLMPSAPPLRARRKHAAQKQQLLVNFARPAPRSKKGTLQRLVEDGVVGLVSPKASKAVRRAWYGSEDPSVAQVGLQASPLALGATGKGLMAAARSPKHVRAMLGATGRGGIPPNEAGRVLKDAGWMFLGGGTAGVGTKLVPDELKRAERRKARKRRERLFGSK